MFLHNPVIDILYVPFLNALVFLYQYLPGHDFGIAVIVLTLLIRLILYPLMAQAIRSQKIMTELQPKIQEIQQKFKNDRERQTKETMALWQKEKINPLGGCLPLLIQMPILIALFRVFWEGIQPGEMVKLYSFVPNPGVINPTFLGIIDLSKSFTLGDGGQGYYWPVFVLAILAGLCQFIQARMIGPKAKKVQGSDQVAKFSGMMQKQMIYFFPVLMVFILLRLPAAIGLYWLITSLFSIGQQYLIFAKQRPTSPA